jgi:hypothetical protein
MRTTGEAVRFSLETGTIKTVSLSEETTDADAAGVATRTVAIAEPINVTAMIRVDMVLVIFFSSGLRGWVLPLFYSRHFTARDPSSSVTHCR